MPPPTELAGARLLIVDDTPQNLRLISDFLAEQGFELMLTRSGAQALEKIHLGTPDLVLLDVRMPEMDGIEAARRLTAVDPRMVIFLVSANEQADAPHGVGSCGAAAFVRKQDLAPSTLHRLWATHGA